jgi:NitT/TauT family transport system substrate-binding protein
MLSYTFPHILFGGQGMRVRYIRTLTALASLGCFTLMLVSGCGQPSSGATANDQPEKTNLVVGAVESVSQAALFIAQQRGIFAAHGLHVTIEGINSTATTIPDLLNGSMDIAAGQVTTFVAGQAKGEGQFRVLAAGLEIGPNTEQIVVPPNSPITSVAQLPGHTIAVNAAAGDGVLLTDDALSVYNIAPNQVSYKVVPFTKMGAALTAGTADAAFCSEPYCTEMEQGIGATELTDLDQGAVQGWMISGYTTTAAWEKKYPNTAAAFAASIVQASNIANTNLEAIQSSLKASVGLSPQVAGVMATGSYPTAIGQDRLEQLIALMIQFGELSPNANTTAVVNALSSGP